LEWVQVAVAGVAAIAVSILVVMLATHQSNSPAPDQKQPPTVAGSAPESPPINLRPRANPDLPREYVTVAKFLSYSTSTKPTSVKPNVDLAQGMAEAQEAILNLDGAEYADPQLEKVARQAVASMRNLVELASELQALPEPPDALSELILAMVQGSAGDVGGFLAHYNDLAEQGKTNQAVWRRIVVELTKLKSHELLLPGIARKYAGPPLSDPRIVAIDLDEALFPELPDRLALRNGSQHVLHHCTLAVTLTGAGGETKKHVHFIQEWPPDEAVYAFYGGGKTPHEPLIRDSLASIASVSVSLYCDELSCQELAYRYSGDERDRDVGAFLRPFRLALQYRPFAPGLIFNDEPAAICSFCGLPALPRGRLAVTFHHGQQSRTQILAFESWQAGAEQTVEFPKLEWRPDAWSAALQLNGSAFQPLLEAPAAAAAPAAKQ
jgi:hypothetical protein